MNTPIKRLFICATSVIALASCGGGNDVASGGAGTGVTSASAVTAGAPSGAAAISATTTASATPAKAAFDRITTPVPSWVMESYLQLFPNNQAGYTAQSLANALAVYNVFDGQDTVQQVYNLAGFLANAAHESGNFTAATEYGYYSNSSSGSVGWGTDGLGKFSTIPVPSPANTPPCYSPPHSSCPAITVPPAPYSNSGVNNCTIAYGVSTSGACFYGRGALQLSHDYNYRVYGQQNGAFANPDVILGSGSPSFTNNLLFDSGVWFWSQASTGLQPIRPMDGFKQNLANTYPKTDPFGNSILVINGALECGSVPDYAKAEAQDRINRFIAYLPVIAGKAGVTLVPGYINASTIGVACTAPSTTGTISVNFVNSGTTGMSVTLLDASGYTNYNTYGMNPNGFIPGGQNQIWTNNTSSTLGSYFKAPFTNPNTNIGIQINYANGTAASRCAQWPVTMAASNNSYTITINPDTGACNFGSNSMGVSVVGP